MPGYGGAIDHGKGHRTKAELARTKVESPGPAEAPELPGGYSPTTCIWYDTWTKAPQAVLFTATDWQRLLMLAPLVDQYYESPRKEDLAEIRLNESLLGATVVDRLRGKIELVAPKVAPTSVATDDLTAKRTSRRGLVA